MRIETATGESVYQSGVLNDPVHVPDVVLRPGDYQWYVDALDVERKTITTRPSQKFSIEENAFELPWMEPKELLSRVPQQHPRLLFPKAKLQEIRASLTDSRKMAYEDLRNVADEALKLGLMIKPDFDKFDRESEYPARRTAYRASYHEFTRIYNRGMIPLALMYQLSGEEKYGQAAKKHLLNVLDWELDGVASLEQSFDEIGLRIARTAAQGYDWLYDLLTESERDVVKQMLIARGDQMLARLERRDFLHKSAYSHDGRLPGYLVEFSIALAEEERAEVWMNYAMRALMTVFPHWGGKDGGWAEGINYVLSYNDRFITPLQSLYEVTGFDLWNMSYFRNMRNFLMYCVSPIGEITPFGDAEHNSVRGRARDIYSILQFHSLRYQDSATRWWIEQLEHVESERESSARFGAMNRIILEDNLEPIQPKSIESDKVFEGVGWAALHSDILDPEDDLMILFKSSPYGSVSHSHADQNSFAIMKGGKALSNPSGARYPQHESPFHFQYTNLTLAHNALLINGEGQIDRSASANGSIVGFQSTPHLGYVAGDAQKCYGNKLNKYNRHMVMIRPSVIIIIDDLSGPDPFSVDWLMHSREEIIFDEDDQSLLNTRFEEAMKTQIFTPGGFDFSVTNVWPIDPKQDYPMVTAEPPANEWHFSATTRKEVSERRIVSVMSIGREDQYPDFDISLENGLVRLSGNLDEGEWEGTINIDLSKNNMQTLMELEYTQTSGVKEKIIISN